MGSDVSPVFGFKGSTVVECMKSVKAVSPLNLTGEVNGKADCFLPRLLVFPGLD